VCSKLALSLLSRKAFLVAQAPGRSRSILEELDDDEVLDASCG
jgi:hypothetical protein